MNIAVLAGGPSAEHYVSLRTASGVVRALRSTHRVHPVFLARDGTWSRLAPRHGGGEVDWASEVALERSRAGIAVAQLCELGVDVVYPALHGRGGEDGTLQGLLDWHDLAYVGSGCAASAVGMDKIRTRESLTANGVPMSTAYVAWFGEAPSITLAAIAKTVGYPCFLKTDLSGSSHGVRRCEDSADVERFLREERGLRFVAERAVAGEEISVPVLGISGRELTALPPVGVYPLKDSWFTPVAKYSPGGSEEVIPPRGLSPEQVSLVQSIACTCHRALGCDGASRTDMIVTPDGAVVVLEVNTLPGMTEASLLPQCARAAGMDFTALLDRLLDLALERRALRRTTAV